MDPAKKRQRTATFYKYEIDLLIEIIYKYKDIVENKKTDGVSVRKKEDTWKTIAEEFNASPGVTYRDAVKLKTCFENSKRKAKQDLADDKTGMKQTGGGTFCPKVDDSTVKILEILGPAATPMENQHDGDGVASETAIDFDVSEEFIIINPCESDKNPGTAMQHLNESVQQEDQRGRKRLQDLPSSSHSAITAACTKRVTVLDETLEAKRKEHLKEMEIKDKDLEIRDLKIKVLKQKLKYWTNKNNA